jgi:glycerol-3-phosphate dehydrogenase
MGGTKGSHFITFQSHLRTALRGGGIYTEASDGRPIFVLPFERGVLVGTTDLPFQGDPATAVASEAELVYLLAAVNRIFPDVRLTRDDVALHYSGVRPLPRVAAGSTSAITRRHLWHWHPNSKVPLLSLIGGKLTTCRAFAEQTVHELLPKLGRQIEADSRERPIRWEAPSPDQIDAARYAIRHQWAKTLSDLVERRLMLLFAPELSVEMLHALARILVEEGQLAATDVETAVATERERLLRHFGRKLTDRIGS